jgi:hypothetical protein
MKMPTWIQNLRRREPAKPYNPSLSVRENFLEFLNKSSNEGFQCLRQQVATSDRYAPYSNELEMLMAALCAGEPQAVIDLYFHRLRS